MYFGQALRSPPELARVVHAGARALREVPLLNGTYRDGRVELHSRVNVAFAVGTGGTLAFPVVRDADRKDAEAIQAEIGALSEDARAGSLSSPALAGATFTIVDMSAAGATSYTPVIVRGQAGALGVGTEELTLACDHRIVQGDEGAAYLSRVASALDG